MNKRLPVTFILITMLLDSMGVGLIFPVMPDLIREVHGGDISNAAIWGGVLATVFAAMQFLFGPLLGSISDRFGRRPVLLLALGAMAIDYLVMAQAWTIWLLLLGRMIGGITAATHATATAYMADISKPEDKAANFGLIGAAFGMGFVLGPLLGGLLGQWGTRAPFYAAALLAVLNFGLGYFALPETVTDRIRRPFSFKRANPIGALMSVGHLPGLKLLLSISFVYGIAFFVYPAIWAYFAALQFGWSPAMIGVSLASFGVSMAIVQAVLMRPILRLIGERNAVIGGLLLDAVVFAALGFVESGTLALIMIPISALGSVVGPALQAIMSRTARDDQQGELQGTLASINAVGMIIAPFILTQIFWYFTSDFTPMYLPGAPFILSAALVLICALLFLRHPYEKLEAENR